MKVLQVNKYLFRNAGAETVYFLTKEALERRGHDVFDFGMRDERNEVVAPDYLLAPRRSYDEGSAASRARDAATMVYDRAARQQFAKVLDEIQPDVVHLHNIYHQLSISLLHELRKRGTPVVMTVHDWKIACPSYTLFRDGAPCRDCVGRTIPVPVLRGRCVKSSQAASAVAFVETATARLGRSYDAVHRFLAPSAFAGEVLTSSGVDASRVVVLPNFVPDVLSEPVPHAERPTILFAGRLEEVKGVRMLLEACEQLRGVEVRIAGHGPLEAQVIESSARLAHVTYLGSLAQDALRREMAASWALCLPAEWEENCPMVILEAKRAARPAVVTARGGLPDLVTDSTGWITDPAPDRLAATLQTAATDLDVARTRGANARRDYEDRFTEERHVPQLLDTYTSAIREARNAR